MVGDHHRSGVSVWIFYGELRCAYSCKGRGVCPGCNTRRTAETAAHPFDHVIPRVRARQWVLSFPIPLRCRFAAHPKLPAAVLQIVHRVIATFLIQQTGLQRTEPRPAPSRSSMFSDPPLTKSPGAILNSRGWPNGVLGIESPK
jgi:hypothetical protein